jgi:HAD superfamily hydrolase (TIGR01509 family)
VDAAGVLIVNGPMTARRRWEREHGRPAGFLDEALSQAVGSGWQGGRSEEQIRRVLAERVGVDLDSLPALLEVLGAHEALNADLASYLTAVRPSLRTAVVANAGPSRRAELVTRFGLDRLVDLIVISAEEQVAKPDPAIYLHACHRLGLAPAGCLFIDDMPANVDGARRAGLHAEVFSSVPRLAASVARLASSGGDHVY